MTATLLPPEALPPDGWLADESEPPATATALVLDVVIPVFNEERDLGPCVERLHAYLTAAFPYRFAITIADNASTDTTGDIARDLARTLPGVRAMHLAEKGRGRALRAAWTQSRADVVAYMDVDLSTDLNAVLPLVAPLISGHSDLAIGSRLTRGSRVIRGTKREVISRCYNLLLRGTLAARFSDAQCGFKAMRREVAASLLPLVHDTGWFFDTELLVIAQKAGLRIHEVPVDWIDDPDSRVDVRATAAADLRGIVRVGRALATGAIPLAELRRQLGREPLEPAVADVPTGLVRQGVRFAAIGIASTVAYLVLFVLLRSGLGPQPANLLALLITAVANTAANRRLTFNRRGRSGAAGSQVRGLVVFAIGFALTSGALAVLDAASPHPGRVPELSVLIGANLLSTVLRFVLFRAWVFRHPQAVAE
jgi:putative flippase GtrA